MGKVKIRYYVVRKGKYGYWLPTAKMQAAGFSAIRCGHDGPSAWAIAQEWNVKWDDCRFGRTPAIRKTYPTGSLGEAFERFKRTATWAGKAPRTHEDWERGWRYIDPVFGDVRPDTVTLEDLDSWYAAMVSNSVAEAFRAMKIWRALWRVAGVMKYCDRDADPSLGIRRQTPKGRHQVWREGEVIRLVKTAWRAGYKGLAALVAVSYDSQLSPVDARALCRAQRRNDALGVYFELDRAKTGQAAVATLSRRTERLMAAYLDIAGTPLKPESPLFRNRSGNAYTKDTLGDDFRSVREMVFGKSESRKLMDLRRTGVVEAITGNVDAGELAAKMANTIDDSRELQRTYAPTSLAAVRGADAARKRGRQAIRQAGKSPES